MRRHLVRRRSLVVAVDLGQQHVIQDLADPAHVLLTEVYRDDEGAAAHKLTPHYAAWRDAVAEMMAQPRRSERYSAVFPAADSGWASGPP